MKRELDARSMTPLEAWLWFAALPPDMRWDWTTRRQQDRTHVIVRRPGFHRESFERKRAAKAGK